MYSILSKVDEVIMNYYCKHERYPNAILINEDDLNCLENYSLHFVINDVGKSKKSKGKPICKVCNLKIIPIRYGEMQAVEVLENYYDFI